MKTRAEFKKFFSAIPEQNWCSESLENAKKQNCVLGHLGFTKEFPTSTKGKLKQKENVLNLAQLLGYKYDKKETKAYNLYEAEVFVYSVNDKGTTPKQNILNALKK